MRGILSGELYVALLRSAVNVQSEKRHGRSTAVSLSR
jgi:hypothetical protein